MKIEVTTNSSQVVRCTCTALVGFAIDHTTALPLARLGFRKAVTWVVSVGILVSVDVEDMGTASVLDRQDIV